jgi:type I restriction enzyme S subunit
MTLRPEASPCTIGEVCDFVSGNGFRPQDWKTKGLPIIRIQNLNGSDSFNYFDGESDPAWIVEPNDLLFAWAGVKGVSFGPTIWNGPKGVLNQHIYRIRPKKGINKRWLYYALLEVTAEIESKAHGFKTSLVHVRKADITRARISLPGEHEQEAVATALECWDTTIQKTEQLIAAKERHYSHELSRLISRGQHPQTHVGAFAEEVSARNCGGNDARVLSVTNSRGFVLPEDQFERRVASADLSNYKVVRRGQYAYNPSRINVGSIARLDGWADGVLSPMYVVFRLDDAKVDSGYFLHWLDSHEARQRIKNSAQGSVRESVSFSEFSAITIPLPDTNTQSAIARYLNALREEIDVLGQSAAALKTQKRGLMQKLLTGQWRLLVSEEVSA